MDYKTFKVGQLFIFSGGSFKEYFIKTELGAFALDNGDEADSHKLSFDVLPVEKWVVYRTYLSQGISQAEVDVRIEEITKDNAIGQGKLFYDKSL